MEKIRLQNDCVSPEWTTVRAEKQSSNADNPVCIQRVYHVLHENFGQKYINILSFYTFTSFLVKKGVKLKTGFSIRCRYSITVAVEQKVT